MWRLGVPWSASGCAAQAVGLDLRAVILARDTDVGEQEGILKITYSNTLIFANEELVVSFRKFLVRLCRRERKN